MRKFLLPIINFVNLVLVSIAWGLSNNTHVIDANGVQNGTFYDLVWMSTKPNVLGIVSFFLFCFGCLAMLVAFLPIKIRKFVSCAAGLMFIAAGVMFVNMPWTCSRSHVYPIELNSAFIAMACLVIIAGAFSLVMSIIEFLPEKKSK